MGGLNYGGWNDGLNLPPGYREPILLFECEECGGEVYGPEPGNIDGENCICEDCTEKRLKEEEAYWRAEFQREGKLDASGRVVQPSPDLCECCRENPISDRADEHHLWCDDCLDARLDPPTFEENPPRRSQA